MIVDAITKYVATAQASQICAELWPHILQLSQHKVKEYRLLYTELCPNLVQAVPQLQV